MRVVFIVRPGLSCVSRRNGTATQTAELQLRFEESIKACVQRVASAPQQFPSIDGRFRRALVEVFPYGIFFEATARQDKDSGDRPQQP